MKALSQRLILTVPILVAALVAATDGIGKMPDSSCTCSRNNRWTLSHSGETPSLCKGRNRLAVFDAVAFLSEASRVLSMTIVRGFLVALLQVKFGPKIE